MRTTLDIDDDVLAVARELAAQRNQSIGAVISDTFRKNRSSRAVGKVRNGIHVIERPRKGSNVTLEMVNKLRDEE